MDRPISSGRHGKLDFMGDAPEASGPESTENEATRELLRVGAWFMLVVASFFALAAVGCASCILLGPDRPSPSQPVIRPSGP